MEHEPLISAESTPSLVTSPGHSDCRSTPEKKRLRSFFLCIFALELCIKFGTTLLELPLLKLVERMVCDRYYGDDRNVSGEEACKIPAVQDMVSLIIEYKLTMDALPCLLTVLHYGSLSDSRGRKFVIMLQITGRLLALLWIVLIGLFVAKAPAELLWISSLFLFIGGGRKAQVSLVYTSFCDMIPEEKRTQLLALVYAAEGLAGIISYPTSSLLLARQLWMPFALAITVCMIEYSVLWHTPETSPFVGLEKRARSPQVTVQNPANLTIKHRQPNLLSRLERESLLKLFQHRGLIIIFFCFFCKRIAFASEEIISQYVSETLHRRISETYWFQACNHFGMLLTLSILIPLFTYRLMRPNKDLWVISVSLVNVIVGFLMLWRSRTIYTVSLGLLACGLGEGFDVGLQSLGSYLVGEKHHGIFFPLASMLGVAGEFFGGPLMAATYAVRDKSGAPLGYCFLLSATLFICLLIGSQFISTKKLLT